MAILRNRRPVAERAPPHRPTHVNNVRPTTQALIPCHNGRNRRRICFICTLPTQHPPCLTTTMMAAAVWESFVGGWGDRTWERLAPFPRRRHVVSGQHRCVDREILICIIPRSLTKDPHPQSIAMCNLESALSPRLNVSLDS